MIHNLFVMYQMMMKSTSNRLLLQSWVCCALVLTLFTADLFAQGYNIFNQRNHPYLNWQVAETEHFRIITPEHISGIQDHAAAIAEETYDALSQNMNAEFEEKIRIYLTDTDDISNGFANPTGKGYSVIWVNINEFDSHRSGPSKWLRHVLAHEIAHIVHYNAIWSNTGLLQYLLGEPIPRFWAEGIAQYQTEEWNAQRGDRWLRKAVFDSRPGYRDGSSIENGRLMYASGHAQLRYLAETYGDSTLANMLSERYKRFGILEYHDIVKAFDEHVDGGYDAFYEEWRKHMNVYYNTLASQMQRTDSLGSKPLTLPGRFYYDAAVSPNDSLIALLSLPSLQRPVRSLYIIRNDSTLKSRKVAEGNIGTDLSWNRDGKRVYYSRRVRGENSMLVRDVFQLNIETEKERQLTHSRRAGYPAQGPGDDEIGYIVNEEGTGNLFVLNTETGEERRITRYEGDLQAHHPLWIPSQNRWMLSVQRENGDRHLVMVDPESGEEMDVIDSADNDNRSPVLSPDGKRVAYHSLRDEVPNVFVYDFETREHTRATHLFTGAEVLGWMAPDSAGAPEKLLIEASESKRYDEIYAADLKRFDEEPETTVPQAYASWRHHSPAHTIPFQIEPDPNEVLRRYEYKPIRNITHAVSFALPYYSDENDWGLFGSTNWTEPLGKHIITGFGSLSIPTPAENSFGAIAYQNNQFYPSITLSAYNLPGNSRFYGKRFLVEELTGGEISVDWPLDAFDRSYRSASIELRLRHVAVDPYDADEFEGNPLVPVPVDGRQTDLQLEWKWTGQKPWYQNHIHPLYGFGIRTRVLGAAEILGSDVEFARVDLSAYTILPSIGLHRIFVHGRFQQQWGTPLPQDFLGFTRYDNVSILLPDQVPLEIFGDADRVRGYRSFVTGDRVFFGSVEYRMPFLPSLETRILGFLELNATTLSLFSDVGIVADAFNPFGTETVFERWGGGAEIKNGLELFGIDIAHTVGVAQPMDELFREEDVDLYYRVKAVIPF